MENLFLLSIEINTDIFEANVINIIILVAGLFNVVGAALKTAMLERKTKTIPLFFGILETCSVFEDRSV